MKRYTAVSYCSNGCVTDEAEQVEDRNGEYLLFADVKELYIRLSCEMPERSKEWMLNQLLSELENRP